MIEHESPIMFLWC